ncbi:hypothetical protein K8R47_03690 [archaeon]|nr:hypothetical protein [archaeon]
MKRTILILFFLVFSFYLVNAADIDLTYPYDGMTNTTSNDVTFQCESSLPNIENITLYNEITGSLIEAVTELGSSLSYLEPAFSNGDYEWYCSATNSNNTIFESSHYTFTIQLNDVTFIGTISDIIWQEDTNLTDEINLSEYFTGASSYSVEGNNNIDVQISNEMVSFYTEENWFGSEQIRFYSGSTYSNYLNLTVNNTNDEPELIEDINNIQISEGTNYNLDLSDYFEDYNDGDLTYSYTDLSHFTISIDNDRAIITPENNWFGSEYIVFMASDGTYNISSNNFSLSVGYSTNQIPEIEVFNPTSINNIYIGEAHRFDVSYSIPGGLPVSVEWYLDNQQVSVNNYYDFTPAQEKEYNITVYISNANGEDSASWIFNVYASSGDTLGNSICGNGVVEEGETCENCPEDVECKKEFNLSLDQVHWKSVFIVLGIIIVVLILLNIIDKKRKSKVDPRLLFQARHEFKESNKNPEYWIKKYIRETLKKGYSKLDVIRECKSKGWNEELVEQLVDDIFRENQEKNL